MFTSSDGDFDTRAFERKLVELAHYGQARCGLGFGKYPLGLIDALRELAPLTNSQEVKTAIDAFEERLRT